MSFLCKGTIAPASIPPLYGEVTEKSGDAVISVPNLMRASTQLKLLLVIFVFLVTKTIGSLLSFREDFFSSLVLSIVPKCYLQEHWP